LRLEQLSFQCRLILETNGLSHLVKSETSLYHEYVLTEMGRQLFPVVTALRQWCCARVADR
jgi:DNA-binding HxlR family transcriptional regulator